MSFCVTPVRVRGPGRPGVTARCREPSAWVCLRVCNRAEKKCEGREVFTGDGAGGGNSEEQAHRPYCAVPCLRQPMAPKLSSHGELNSVTVGSKVNLPGAGRVSFALHSDGRLGRAAPREAQK